MRYLLAAIGCVLILVSAAIIVDNETRQMDPAIHVHLPMSYKMMGRIHTDTLCVHPDTALYENSNHRPVPAVLSGVAGETMDQYQIIIDKPF